MLRCFSVDSSSGGSGAAPPSATWWFNSVFAAYAAVFLAYAVTWAFTFDEAYELLAAQLIAAGKTPYLDFCYPQTPLGAYWNAAWIRLAGANWRILHLLAAMFTVGAVWLAADYVKRRFPEREWRLAGALLILVGTGLNPMVFEYGALRSYGMCLLCLLAGFRAAVKAVDDDGWQRAGAAGLLAGVAAGASLLAAAAAPVLLVWGWCCNRGGDRRRKAAAFCAGLAIPFATVFWLLARAPRQTWFNVVRYHAFYRQIYWPGTTQHDLEVLTSWIDSGQALLLIVLGLAGLLFIVRRSGWAQDVKSELYLCGWLAAALSAESGRAHPTFGRYFLLSVPFAATLAAAGLLAVSRAFDARRPVWPAAVASLLFALGLGRALYDRRDADTWSTFERVAARIQQVTPPGAPVLALEPMYFLTRRTPPEGFENYYTHELNLPPAEAASLHIVNNEEVKRRLRAGMFATACSCDDDEIADWDLKKLYRQHAELESCGVFWEHAR